MPEHKSNLTLEGAAAMLKSARRIAVTTHAKPDGDAFGAVAALTRALRLMGKEAAGVLAPPVPATFSPLRGSAVTRTFSDTTPLPDADLLVILDTGAWAQVSPMRKQIEPRLSSTLVLDHHLTGDIDAAGKYVDTASGSCCEIVAQVIDALAGVSHEAGGPARANPLMDALVAESIYVGIVSDTGWFRYPNTRPQTHELASRLLRLGVNQADLFNLLEQSHRPQKLALTQRALTGMRMMCGNKAALIVLRAEDFSQTGALIEETEGIVDLPRSVAGVEVVAVVSQAPGDQAVRVSFRSRSGAGAVDVSKLAQGFGGGGHARAAGAKVTGKAIDVVADEVARAIAALL